MESTFNKEETNNIDDSLNNIPTPPILNDIDNINNIDNLTTTEQPTNKRQRKKIADQLRAH